MPKHISVEECTANLTHGVTNLLALYAQCTAADIESGTAWYRTAHNDAQRISMLYDVPFDTVIKVACALSPRLEWSQNMPAAESVIRWFISGGFVPSIAPYKAKEINLQRTRHTMDVPVITDDWRIPAIQGPTKTNIVKALWILQGHEWVLRGPKVNSFCDNIKHYDTSDAVTVDSHAIQCWRGVMEAGTYAVPAQFYAVIAADFRIVAKMLGYSALVLQAILWIAKKRITAQRIKAERQARRDAKLVRKIMPVHSKEAA